MTDRITRCPALRFGITAGASAALSRSNAPGDEMKLRKGISGREGIRTLGLLVANGATILMRHGAATA
jgi:hypothetical protein